jgi:hypothetical protein
MYIECRATLARFGSNAIESHDWLLCIQVMCECGNENKTSVSGDLNFANSGTRIERKFLNTIQWQCW